MHGPFAEGNTEELVGLYTSAVEEAFLIQTPGSLKETTQLFIWLRINFVCFGTLACPCGRSLGGNPGSL